MAIKINKDKIQFRNFSMQVSADGFYVDGTFTANGQFVDSTFQGSVSGYTGGGFTSSYSNTIDKFPFAVDGNATDVGDLTGALAQAGTQSSSTHGYHTGAFGTPPVGSNVIQKYPFVSDNNAGDVGDLTAVKAASIAGQSSSEYGYATSGSVPTNPLANRGLDDIDKFPFAVDTNASDVGTLTVDRSSSLGHSSATHGYTAGQYSYPLTAASDVIDKFPFATDSNATDVGNLAEAYNFLGGGKSSVTHGYVAGGFGPPVPAFVTTIQKYPFVSDTNASAVADLATAEGRGGAGQSSTTSGYHSGGRTPGETYANDIQKFPFASDTNATEVGSLTLGRYYGGGNQV